MKISKSHVWVKLINPKQAKMGISQFAQKELGEIVYIELPTLNARLSKESLMAVLESTKAATDVYSPVSGRIIAVNDLLKTNPGLINHSPEEQAWIIEIELDNPEELNELDEARAK